jgi:hypothetical protein
VNLLKFFQAAAKKFRLASTLQRATALICLCLSAALPRGKLGRYVKIIAALLAWVITMNVIQTPPVEIALRTLGTEDRQKVVAWFDHLKNWEKDKYVRSHAKRLNSSENVYFLETNGDFCIFFRLEQDCIVLLDIATKETILSFGHFAESGQS